MRSLPSITLVAIFAGLTVLYFPLAVGSSLIETFWSARVAAGAGPALLDAVVCFVLCLSVALGVLVFPMAFAGYLHAESSWVRVLTVGLLWSLPSLAFGYFVGEFKFAMQAYDYFLGIEIPVLAATVFYWRTQKWMQSALVAAIGMYLGIFLIGDVIGPFPTFVRYSTDTGTFYALRTFLSMLAFASVVFLPLRATVPAAAGPHRSWMLGLGLAGIALALFRPFLTGETVVMASDFAPVAMVLAAFLVRKERMRLWFALAAVATLLIPVARALLHADATLWGQALLSYQTLALTSFLWMVWTLRSERLRTQSVHHTRKGSSFS